LSPEVAPAVPSVGKAPHAAKQPAASTKSVVHWLTQKVFMREQ
jgi:hypothetical protein